MKFRTGFSLGKLTCVRTVATVFVLGCMTCPMAFAVERGKQEGKRVAREILSRAVGIEQADSLLSQLGRMNLGTIISSNTASNVLTLERPDGTYVFDNLARDANGGLSGTVTFYNPNGDKTGEIDISHVMIVDDNRIDFSVTVSTPNEQQTVNGTIVGMAPGQAIVVTSADGEGTRPSLVSFETPTVVGSSTTSASPVVITATAMTAVDSDPGGIASGGWWEWTLCAVGFTTCAVVIVVVVAFVAVTCLAFGWFGCDA